MSQTLFDDSKLGFKQNSVFWSNVKKKKKLGSVFSMIIFGGQNLSVIEHVISKSLTHVCNKMFSCKKKKIYFLKYTYVYVHNCDVCFCNQKCDLIWCLDCKSHRSFLFFSLVCYDAWYNDWPRISNFNLSIFLLLGNTTAIILGFCDIEILKF